MTGDWPARPVSHAAVRAALAGLDAHVAIVRAFKRTYVEVPFDFDDPEQVAAAERLAEQVAAALRSAGYTAEVGARSLSVLVGPR